MKEQDIETDSARQFWVEVWDEIAARGQWDEQLQKYLRKEGDNNEPKRILREATAGGTRLY